MIRQMLICANAPYSPLADGSVHCVITSPPYYGLRDYDLSPIVWGGDSSCVHSWSAAHLPSVPRRGNKPGDYSTSSLTNPERQDRMMRVRGSQSCTRCGAWLGCLGQEPTPELFIAHMVAIFREVKRVLRPDGTCWIVIGDSYARSPSRGVKFEAGPSTYMRNRQADEGNRVQDVPDDMQEKDLMGIPWMLAFALRADGWIVRSAPPWLKINAMPDSTPDRPGISHETIFMLSKSPRYFYDREAVKRPAKLESIARAKRARSDHHKMVAGAPGQARHTMHKAKPNENRVGPKDYGATGIARHRSAAQALDGFAAAVNKQDGAGNPTYKGFNARWDQQTTVGRNRRTADWAFEQLDGMIARMESWLSHARHVRDHGGMLCDEDGYPDAFLVTPKNYKGQHYATYPPDLIEPMIKAGTSERGCCPTCGAQWEAVVASHFVPQSDVSAVKGVRGHNGQKPMDASNGWQGVPRGTTETNVTGYRPSCGCYDDRYHELPRTRNARKRRRQDMRGDWLPRARQRPGGDDWPTVPAIVFDPFVGSGSTLLMAQLLGRRGIGADLSLDYLRDQARDRLGLIALTAWQLAKAKQAGEARLDDLPLFASNGEQGI